MNLELLTSRICCNKLRWNEYQITSPSPDDRYLAQEIFFAQEEPLIEDFWSEKEQERLQNIPKEIETFKTELYKSYKVDPKRASVIRKYLSVAKEELAKLSSKKLQAQMYTEYGQALINRNKFLVILSLRKNGKRVVESEDDYFLLAEEFVENACSFYNSKKITEEEIRKVARNEPWRSIWVCAKVEGRLFGTPASEYSDEQKSLVVWSGIYDSVYQHPEKPEDIVIDDDDCFDGWMILQRNGQKVNHDGITNDKIRNSDQILITAKTVDQSGNEVVDVSKIKSIENLNSPNAKRIRGQILKEKHDSGKTSGIQEGTG